MGLFSVPVRALRKAKDIVWIVLIAVSSFGFSFAVLYSRADPLEHPSFLQTNLLLPSVFFAAGKGMGTADMEAVSGLKSFILKETTSFDKRTIPDELIIQPLTTELEVRHLYYLYAVGWVWRLFGISIQSLVVFSVLWYTLNGLAVYGIYRSFFRPLTSFFGALLFFTLPLHFYPLIGLREQGSVPFMLWILWGIVFLIRKCRSKKSYFLIAALCGMWIALGMGFRGEIPIYCPPVVITLLLFPQREPRFSMKVRMVAVALFASTLLLFMIPLTQTVDGAHGHTFFVGLGPDVEKEIPFGNASYENLPSTDTAVYAQVSTFARRSGDQTCMVNMKSAEYARSSGNKSAPLLWDPFIHFNGDCYRHHTMALMKSVIWHTPADLITRAWYSALQLPETFGRVLSEMKKMKQPHWLMRWTTFCDFIFIVQLKMSFLCTLYLLLCCALKSHMRALFWFALLVWFTGYPSLQYEFRNYYFMAFLPTLVIFLTVAHVISFLNQFLLKEKKKTDSPSAHKWIKTLQRSVVFLSCVIFSIFTPILVLRMWQVHKIHSLARTLTEAPLQEIEISYSKEEGTCLIVPKETLPGLINAQTLPAGETAWQYLAVEVNTGGEDIPIKIQYEPLQIMYDFSQTITLFGIPDNKKGSLLFFFPVYEVDMNYGETLMASEILQMYPGIKGIVDSDLPLEEQQWWRRGKFKGISVPEDSKHAIGKMYIVSPAEELSWLPIFQLPEDSRYLRCYKTGVIEEGFRRWVRRIKKI